MVLSNIDTSQVFQLQFTYFEKILGIFEDGLSFKKRFEKNTSDGSLISIFANQIGPTKMGLQMKNIYLGPYLCSNVCAVEVSGLLS